MKMFLKIFVATMVFVLLLYFGMAFFKNNKPSDADLSIKEL